MKYVLLCVFVLSMGCQNSKISDLEKRVNILESRKNQEKVINGSWELTTSNPVMRPIEQPKSEIVYRKD